MSRSLLSLALFSLLLSPAAAENWPAWRGPSLNGVSASKTAPTKWDAETNVLWRTALPGPAGSTPVVWGDKIFLTSTDGDQLVLICLDTKGDILWKKNVDEGNKNVRGDEGNTASPTPSTDGKHVWTFFANGVLACFDFEGNEIWKFNVGERFGPLKIDYGMTSTPLLDGGRLYLQLVHGDRDVETQEAVVACLDGASGETIWKTGRPSDAYAENEHSYASPIIYRDAEHEFLVTHGADYVIAHSLKDGSEIWRCGGLNPKGTYNPALRFVASPAAGEGLIVVPTAKNGKVVAIRPGGSGDITDSEQYIAWVLPRNTPDVPSPLIKDGLVYLCRENGNLMALDAKSGDVLYEERTERDRHRASPVWADGHVYTTARNGTVTIAKAGREFELVSKNSIEEPIAASPVIVGGRIYLRSFEALWAIGEE